MAFTLFLPDRTPTIEDRYAKNLAMTIGASIVTIGGQDMRADGPPHGAAQNAWAALPADARPLIEGTILAAFAPFTPFFPSKRAAVFLHHPRAAAPADARPPEQRRTEIEQEALGHAPHVIVSSDAVRAAILEQGNVPPARIAVIEPPAPRPAPARSASGSTVSILAGAQPVAAEAQAALLATLARLLDLDWRLSIIVDASEDRHTLAELPAMIAARKLSGRVSVVDAKDCARCEELWCGADIFSLTQAGPGYDEAVALALSRGIPPAICRGQGGAPAIPAEAGAIAPPGDYAGLGKALRRMIFDRELHAEMAAAALGAGQHLPDARAVGQRLASVLG